MQVFFIFLGLSTVLWLISKLSKEYVHTVKVKAAYTNFTSDKELQTKPKEQLELVLKTTGFNLLGYTTFKNKLAIDLSKIQKQKNRYFYLTNANLSSLQSQLPSDVSLLSVYPDTLFFDFGKLQSKKVVIIPKLAIKYRKGYNLIGDLEIQPKKVLLNGTDKQVKGIEKIYTKNFNLKNVDGDFEYKVPLDIPKEYEKIHFSVKEIVIKGTVVKVTEASLEVPFELINVPKNYVIKTFTDKVKITYKVSLANYDKIQVSSFKVICDFKNIKDSNSSFLIPKIIEKPNLVSNIRIRPKKIEFLIKK